MADPSARTGLIAALATAVALAAMFALTGTFSPDQVPDYASSPRQITGMALMLTLIPPYFVAALWLTRARSLALIDQLRPLVPDPAVVERARETVARSVRDHWKLGTAVGLVFGLLNTEPIKAFTESPIPGVEGSISIGQLLLWWLIGLMLLSRIATARAIRGLGAAVEVDVLRLERLRALGRAGVVDIVVVAGALLLSPLQSIDAEFRWYNYRFAIVVALPSAAFFLTWPLLPVHRRIQADRDARLRAVEAQLDQAGPAASTESLEALLAHRDRLRTARTWPLSSATLSRVLLYLVLPPLAWAGAALVEQVIEWALKR